jgi:hypothetical protein
MAGGWNPGDLGSIFDDIDRGAGDEIGVSLFGGIDDSGDGSDDDLDAIAQQAADTAKQAVLQTCSNPGMEALAEMVADAIDELADGLADGEPPDMEVMFDAISGVHSSDTARSCMTQGINRAGVILGQAYRAIQIHELAGEGRSFGEIL